MKKINWILLVIFVIISAFLLWLWFYLGFNHVDSPLDLVLSIIWWIIFILGVFIIWRLEKRRQERIRTLYISDSKIFNSELGIRVFGDLEQLVFVMGQTLEELKYNFNREDLPEHEELPMRFLVRTFAYKADKEDEEENTWEGEVCVVGVEEPTPFETRDELIQIVTALKAGTTSQQQETEVTTTVIQ